MISTFLWLLLNILGYLSKHYIVLGTALSAHKKCYSKSGTIIGGRSVTLTGSRCSSLIGESLRNGNAGKA